MKEVKYYLNNYTNYHHIIRTMGNSDYKLETIEFTDEYNRKWIFKNCFYKKNNKLYMVEWKCIFDSFEKQGILRKKSEKEQMRQGGIEPPALPW